MVIAVDSIIIIDSRINLPFTSVSMDRKSKSLYFQSLKIRSLVYSSQVFMTQPPAAPSIVFLCTTTLHDLFRALFLKYLKYLKIFP